MEDYRTDIQKHLWTMARMGILIFCGIHLILEIVSGNTKAIFPVVIGYFISAWYIKSQIKKGKEFNNPILAGVLVSATVFLMRVVLGVIIYLIGTNNA